MELLIFAIISASFIVIPGPNVLVIMATSIKHGRTRGLQTVAGTSSAMILQLIIAGLGTSYFISVLAEGFIWLKWIGVAYLLYLGISHLWRAYVGDSSTPPISASGSFQRGFWVSLTNPKTILFFGAFLPQFVQADSPYLLQIVILSAIFWSIAVVFDCVFAVCASKLSGWLKEKAFNRRQDGFVGILYCGAGTVLARLNVSQ